MTAYVVEDVPTITDADLETRELEAAGAAIHAARLAGRCCHTSAVGYRVPALYPAQEGLRPGQLRCTDGCGVVFASEAAWLDAMAEATD